MPSKDGFDALLDVSNAQLRASLSEHMDDGVSDCAELTPSVRRDSRRATRLPALLIPTATRETLEKQLELRV